MSKLIRGMFVLLTLAACGGEKKSDPPKADPPVADKPVTPAPTPAPPPSLEPVATPAEGSGAEGSGAEGSGSAAAAAANPNGRQEAGKMQMLDRRKLLEDARRKLDARKKAAQ